MFWSNWHNYKDRLDRLLLRLLGLCVLEEILSTPFSLLKTPNKEASISESEGSTSMPSLILQGLHIYEEWKNKLPFVSAGYPPLLLESAKRTILRSWHCLCPACKSHLYLKDKWDQKALRRSLILNLMVKLVLSFLQVACTDQGKGSPSVICHNNVEVSKQTCTGQKFDALIDHEREYKTQMGLAHSWLEDDRLSICIVTSSSTTYQTPFCPWYHFPACNNRYFQVATRIARLLRSYD